MARPLAARFRAKPFTFSLPAGKSRQSRWPTSGASVGKRQGEPDEWKFSQPLLLLRNGDRLLVDLPQTEITLTTRLGILRLKPQVIAAIDFAPRFDGA